VGLAGGADATATTPPPAKPKVIEAKRTDAPPRPEAAAPKATAPKTDTKPAASRLPLKPSIADAPAQAAPATRDNLVAGSAPIVSSNSFDSRFGAVK
jgi:hypothetical protein